jgi:hypothetical protein
VQTVAAQELRSRPSLWSAVAAVVGLVTFAVGITMSVLIGRADGGDDGLWVAVWLCAPVVGGLTAALRPRNAVGWVLLGAGVVGTGSQFLLAYSPALPISGLEAVALAASAPVLYLALLLIALLVLLFPSGTLAPGWRRWLVKIAAANYAIASLASFFLPTISGDVRNYHNPLSVAGLDKPAQLLISVATTLFVGIFLVAAVDAVWRQRRSSGIQRQQFKWLAYSSVLVFPALVFVVVTPGNWWVSVLPLVITANTMVATIGLSIVRYRLYDIDRLVSRTVSYLIVVGLLFGVYIGCVLLMTTILPLRGSVSVVIAVLIAVALFAPLRSRARATVDKRFNRSRYNAQAVVDAFASRLGEQVSVEAISADLLAAVDQTVQPTHSSLWLRGPY